MELLESLKKRKTPKIDPRANVNVWDLNESEREAVLNLYKFTLYKWKNMYSPEQVEKDPEKIKESNKY
jgi:hypothetical protein